MTNISIGELNNRVVSYTEEYPAPIDPQLQQAVRIGAWIIAASLPVSIVFEAMLMQWARAGFFLYLGDLSVLPLGLLSSPVGIVCNVLALIGFGILWYQSQGIESGPMLWHRVAFGISAVGAIDLAILGIPTLIVVLNLLLWVALIVMIVIGIGFALVALSIVAAVAAAG